MSASKGDSSSGDGNNYFSTLQAPFPKLIGGKISTSEFLQASQNVVELVGELFNSDWQVDDEGTLFMCTYSELRCYFSDRFGHIFAPVKYDMSGNIKVKIILIFKTSNEKHEQMFQIRRKAILVCTVLPNVSIYFYLIWFFFWIEFIIKREFHLFVSVYNIILLLRMVNRRSIAVVTCLWEIYRNYFHQPCA